MVQHKTMSILAQSVIENSDSSYGQESTTSTNTMGTWPANSFDHSLGMNTQLALDSHNLLRYEKPQSGDAVEAYFECITTCSLDDGECITSCTEILREQG
jgi:hypothetical protein